jgi:hypothetical protein
VSAATTIADVWQREVVDADRESAVLVLTSFLVTFGVTRSITHAIRAQRVPFLRNMSVGGTHLHHLVPGIFLLLIAGLLGIAVEAPLPDWVVPIIFGIGAALTLDEFALWLHLEDVYWAQEGRRSIDAVIIAAALFGLSIIGYPFWYGVWTDVVNLDNATVAGFHIVGLVLAAACLSKGKLYEAAVGAFVAPVALIGVLRLATPGSPWAQRFYRDDKMARSVARYGPPRGARGVTREVEVAAERPALNWRWLVRWGIALVVTVLIVVDAVVREPAVSNFAVLLLVLVAVALESTGLRRRAGRPAAPPPPPSPTIAVEGTSEASEGATAPVGRPKP